MGEPNREKQQIVEIKPEESESIGELQIEYEGIKITVQTNISSEQLQMILQALKSC